MEELPVIKQKAIIIDIDGTIADMEHRVLHKKDKELFYSITHLDRPIRGTIDIVQRYMDDLDVQVIFLTSRPEKVREITEEWLEAHVTGERNYKYLLLMRTHEDKREDTEVKRDIYQDIVEPQYDVLFVIEDRKRVVQMWRDLGLICLQTCLGDY